MPNASGDLEYVLTSIDISLSQYITIITVEDTVVEMLSSVVIFCTAMHWQLLQIYVHSVSRFVKYK
jgi:hypothetical protein